MPWESKAEILKGYPGREYRREEIVNGCLQVEIVEFDMARGEWLKSVTRVPVDEISVTEYLSERRPWSGDS